MVTLSYISNLCHSSYGVARGSKITPAPYEKAQASEEICKRAAHPGSKLILK